jgi:hypothetical protein
MVLVAILAFVANEIFEWGLLGLYGRKSEAAALLIGLLALPASRDGELLQINDRSLHDLDTDRSLRRMDADTF